MILMINYEAKQGPFGAHNHRAAVFDEIDYAEHFVRDVEQDGDSPVIENAQEGPEPIQDRYHKMHYFGISTGKNRCIQVDCHMRDDRVIGVVVGAAQAYLCNDQGKTIERLR